jgi:2-methylcitrate dehydratase PrpD
LEQQFRDRRRLAILLPSFATRSQSLGQETSMGSLTLDLGRFVAELSLRQIPAEGCAIARTGVADCFGVMVAGARDREIELIDRELGSDHGTMLASLIPSGARRTTESAALVNGVAAHVLDYDDVSLDGHPSAVLMPAILAQAETSGSSGAEMLTAYVAGFEVWGELLAREPVPLHRKGWHPSAVLGPIAAAAACAKLRGLGGNETATAMAIAASMASGLVANFGTMTKSFQVGRAAQSGVIAARLAAAGLTASLDALEHPAGLLAALSADGKAELDRPFDAAHKHWHIVEHGLNIKRYPICYATHRSIDAALDLVERHNLSPDQVEGIHVSTGRTQLLMLRNARPQTGLEAKFSMQFAMAAALVARGVGLGELTDSFVRRPDVQAIFPRVSFTAIEETKEGSNFAPADAVAITTRSGKTFASGPVEYAKGSHQRPLSRDELWQKFTDCLGAEFHETTKSRAFEKLTMLDRLNGAGDLTLRN